MAESDFQAEPPRERRPRPPDMPGDEQVQEGPLPERPRLRAERIRTAEYDEGPDAVEVFIPYKNPKGLIAYYVGLFSLVPCLGLLLGPAGIILGIMGLRYSKANPQARGAGHAIAGIVLGAVGSLANYGVLLLVLGAAAFGR
jgi:hypothetical protein